MTREQYNRETLEYMEKYLFDRTKNYTQKDFSDLNWISVDTLKVKKENPTKIETHFHRDTTYKYPDEDDSKLRLWLCQGAWHLADYKDEDVELKETSDAIHQNILQESGMVKDGWWYTHYAEIPSKEYMFNKFYADKFSNTSEVVKNAKKILKETERKNKETEKKYEQKWSIIDHATFFVSGNLPKSVKAEIDLKSFPVKYNNKKIGRATLIEFDDKKINIAVNIDYKPWTKIGSSKSKFIYDIDNDESEIDGKSYVTKFKSMTITF